jgi:hypothetical protein
MFVLGLVLSFVGILVLAAARPGGARTYFATVSRPPTAQTAVIVAHHVLLLPNQSMWVLVPAMGGCDGIQGGGVSATFLCYSRFPTAVSLTPEGLISGKPEVGADFGSAPSGYLLFLLVPALSVVLGGRYAARKRARLKWEAVGVGAASGVVFAVLLALASWLASVSAGITSSTGSVPTDASVLIGPGVWVAGLLGFVWGVVGGGLGGWLAGRKFPPRATLPEPSNPLIRSTPRTAQPDAAGPRG